MSLLGTIVGKWFGVRPQELIKVFLLSAVYFLLIGGYTVTRDLKNSIFISVVGKEYISLAKIIGMLALVPAILFYSRLVDRIRRYQLLYFYSIFFGLFSLVFAYFMGHPEIGISNTDSSPYRLFGWLFYFFVEGYSPFMVSVFWSFANSITTPEDAKKNYAPMVVGSKLGGMFSAAIAWYLFSVSGNGVMHHFSDITAHRLIMALSAGLLLLVPAVITILMKVVSGYSLHGYEAAYKVEKEKSKKGKAKTGMFVGLKMMLEQPYVLGIFGIVCFYEFIGTVLSYLRLGVAETDATSVSDVSRILFEMVFKTHTIGLILTLFGTSALLNRLGTKICLMLVPVLMGALLVVLMFTPSSHVLINVFIAFKAIHYAFNWPVRESLYIPTVKEIKFKSKSWIDSFGSKFAKTTGSTFNIIAEGMGGALLLPIHALFFATAIGAWFLTSFFLGRRFEKAITNDEVIGAQK